MKLRKNNSIIDCLFTHHVCFKKMLVIPNSFFKIICSNEMVEFFCIEIFFQM